MRKKVLISLHDVTPFHLERIQKAEQLFSLWGIPKINYLFIPDYHRKNLHSDKKLLSAFNRWVREKKKNKIRVEWILHGYFHLEIKANTLLTANEGEFLTLSPSEIDNRLREGKAVFHEEFDRFPYTFVAPAWQFNEHLIPALKRHRFRLTEDHSFIYLLDKDKTLRAPVITWATRTPPRKFVSRVGCPLLNRWWSGKDLVRVAVHPFDFDHPSTVKSIEKVITDVLDKREPILYNELR